MTDAAAGLAQPGSIDTHLRGPVCEMKSMTDAEKEIALLLIGGWRKGNYYSARGINPSWNKTGMEWHDISDSDSFYSALSLDEACKLEGIL